MKQCGNKEECFVKGECWGHLEDIMCKYLSEKNKDGKQVSVCGKTNEEVQYEPCKGDERR